MWYLYSASCIAYTLGKSVWLVNGCLWVTIPAPMSIAISLVSLAESSSLELAGGPGLPTGPKLNKAFMTQAVSVTPQWKKGNYHSREYFLQQGSVNRERLFCICFSNRSTWNMTVLLIWGISDLIFLSVAAFISKALLLADILQDFMCWNHLFNCTYLHW